MEHPSPPPSPSPLPKVIGGIVALVLIGAAGYVMYSRSQLGNSIDAVNAYDNCKTGILAHVVRPDKTEFLTKPSDVKIMPSAHEFSILMKVRASNGYGQMLTITYRCTIAKVNGDFYWEPNLEEVSRQ